MKNAARLYDRPECFADMVIGQLGAYKEVTAERSEEDPLLLDVRWNEGAIDDKLRVSLHGTYQTYLATGDLNAAVDYLNGIVRNTELIRRKQAEAMKLDSAYIYPAIRDERYVEEADKLSRTLSEPYLPGLRVIYLEIKDGCTKIINESMLELQPRLTEDRIKRLAHRNLRSAGWHSPSLVLPSPNCSSCTVEVYTDPPHPMECQFLIPEMSAAHLPSRYLIAFTNRQSVVLMRSTDKMDTKEQVKRLVQKSRFGEVVKRSFHLLPSGVSPRIYSVCNGVAEPLD